MRFVKKAVNLFFVCLIFFILLGFFTKQTTAADPCADPNIPCAGTQTSNNSAPDTSSDTFGQSDVTPDFTTNPDGKNISDGTQQVKVTFNNLTGKENAICTGNNSCFVGLGSRDNSGTVGFPTLFFNDDELITDFQGIKVQDLGITLPICGNDNEVQICKDPGNHYFIGGQMYTFSIGIKKDNLYYPQKFAFFYVPRSFPTPHIDPTDDLTVKSTIKVTLDPPKDDHGNSAIRGGGGTGVWLRNNYKISMIGGGAISKGGCVGWFNKGDTNTIGVTFSNLTRGRYTLSISEQTSDSDSNPWKKKDKDSSIVQAQDDPNNHDCEGGFPYWRAVCEVTPDHPGGKCSKPVRDPSGQEYKDFLNDLDALNSIAPGMKYPCGGGKNTVNNSCPSVDTAIGTIQVTPQGFITDIFTFVLTIAGFGSMIIIIYAGYTFMVSRGDKEKIAGARETLTSAIVGLLFIILSIVILEIIGVDILRIPGIGR